MPNFNMLAGTINTTKNLNDMSEFLTAKGFDFKCEDDEIELSGVATLTLRPGFDHEFIIVGGSQDKSVLKQESQLFSDALKGEQIEHELEFYDKANELYDVIGYKP